MIIRIIVQDPAPRDPHNDLIIYQVPENGRAHQLLVELLNNAGIDHIKVDFPRKQSKENAK